MNSHPVKLSFSNDFPKRTIANSKVISAEGSKNASKLAEVFKRPAKIADCSKNATQDVTSKDSKSLGVVFYLFCVAIISLQVIILLVGLRGDFMVTETFSSGAAPTVTTGKCLVKNNFQGQKHYLQEGCSTLKNNADRFAAGCFPVGVPAWHPENNILLNFPNPAECNVAVSPTWTIAGWQTTYVQVAPGQVFVPPKATDEEQPVLKLLRGSVYDINVNGILRADGRWETFVVTPPNRPASLWLGHHIQKIEADDAGAAFVYFKVPKRIMNTPITSMLTYPALNIDGPFSEHLQWTQFGSYYNSFENVEFYNLAGMLLNEYDGNRLSYFQWWTFREDGDADGYHDHNDQTSQNAFAELHMAMYTATSISGMQTTLPGTQNLRVVTSPQNIHPNEKHKYKLNEQTEVQISIPMPPGFVHGPLWSVNDQTGEPSRTCQGGVLYPYHRWLSGAGMGKNGYHNPPRYSMWIAFEHVPEHTKIPPSMMVYWQNANLQSTMDARTC